ncbi:MAG: hypothetical protein ACREJO_10625 [Phycisphaerales bacterium]
MPSPHLAGAPPVLLLPIYAVIVWYATFRMRRRVIGVALPIIAAAAVVLLLRVILTAMRGFGLSPNTDGATITLILYGEAIAVAAVGLFIAALPRTPSFPHCPYCFYDLSGLDTTSGADFTCPECGMPSHGFAKRSSAPPESPGQSGEQHKPGADSQ